MHTPRDCLTYGMPKDTNRKARRFAIGVRLRKLLHHRRLTAKLVDDFDRAIARERATLEENEKR